MRAPPFHAPPSVPVPLRLARPLLDPQLWCVGCDIRHPAGNALLRYGFARVRPPAGESGSSAYVLALPSGGRCVLWGFAVWCEAPAGDLGLVLHRHPFAVRVTAAPLRLPLWRAEQLPAGTALARATDDESTALDLLADTARALACYERWALATLGVEHRRRCEAERPRAVRRRHAVRCEALGSAWEALATHASSLAGAAGMDPVPHVPAASFPLPLRGAA